jgi:thioredoxin reductase (NADPH)
MQALRYLTDDERGRILARSERRTFAADDVIVREGEPHEAIYLLTGGRARVEKASEAGPVLVEELAPGDAFGEMSLLDGGVTSTSVVAVEPAEVAVLDLMSIADLLEDDPRLASHLYHSLAVMVIQRLRDRTEEMVRTGPPPG